MAVAIRPKDFLDRYTRLKVPDPNTGSIVEVAMTAYGSGWGDGPKPNRPTLGPLCQAEYGQKFKLAVRKAVTGSAAKIPSTPLYFTNPQFTAIASSEPFYSMSFIRTFVGKGSPEEIIDTLRIALATSRIGTGKDIAGAPCAKSSLQDYVRSFISLDCNGLVGNYYGVNPENSIEFYAAPSRRRLKPADIKMGDALVTINAGGAYEHIAMVDEFTAPPTTEAEPTCYMKICEWGQEGDETKHYTGSTPKPVKVKRGPKTALGLGFASGTSFRYFFAPPQDPSPRDWGLNGDQTK